MAPTPVPTLAGLPTIVTANDDGSLNVRVARGCGDDDGDWIKLPEPTARQFAALIDLAERIDVEMPDPPTALTEATNTPEGREHYIEQAKARRLSQYSEDSPAARAFIDLVELLTARKLTLDELHLGAMKPLTIGAIIRGFEVPLGGVDSLIEEANEADEPPTRAPVVPVPLALDSEVAEPGSPDGTEPVAPSTPPSSIA